MAAGWAAATLAAGSATWATVATYGADSGPASGRVLDQAAVHRLLTADGAAAMTQRTQRTQRPHKPHRLQRPSEAGRSASAPSPWGGAPPPEPADGGGAGSAPSRASEGTGRAARAQSRSWSFEGGRAGVVCTGQTAALVYATPDDG